LKRVNGKIVWRKPVARGIFILAIELEDDIGTVFPGNFVMLKTDGIENILPRPFSIFEKKENVLKIMVKAVGAVTNKLFECQLPQSVSIVGPLGNSFPLVKGNNIIVAGGIGLAPVFNLKQHLEIEKIFVGFRTKEEAFLIDEISRINDYLISTDDGSLYNRGFITDFVEDYLIKNRNRPFNIYACGPEPFLKRLWDLGRRFEGTNIYGSFETYMACGFGVCLGCTIDTPSGYVKVCTDGPVFNLTDIFGA